MSPTVQEAVGAVLQAQHGVVPSLTSGGSCHQKISMRHWAKEDYLRNDRTRLWKCRLRKESWRWARDVLEPNRVERVVSDCCPKQTLRHYDSICAHGAGSGTLFPNFMMSNRRPIVGRAQGQLYH